MNESDPMQAVPPEQEMPTGDMQDQNAQGLHEEQDDMPSGSMEPGE